MKLVKIDDYTYVNPESIGAIKDDYLGTNIYLTGSDKPIETSAEIKKALDAICGSEEHLWKKDNQFVLIRKNVSYMNKDFRKPNNTFTWGFYGTNKNSKFQCVSD